MSGFIYAHVGFSCREIQLPDSGLPCGINKLDAICRECRVIKGVEGAGDLSISLFVGTSPQESPTYSYDWT